MKTSSRVLILVLSVVIFGTAGYLFYQTYFKKEVDIVNDQIAQIDEIITNTNPEPIVGGDKDEHGCIGSAGYTWCEIKSKCLRVWEEKCVSIEDELRQILADKYVKPIEQVNVQITKSDETHVVGHIIFGAGGPGEEGQFLAVKINEIWQIVYDGNGSVDCNKLKTEYGFSSELLSPNYCD